MKSRRILLVSDSPDNTSGFARITRDLVRHLKQEPQWEVAVAGYWGIGDPNLGVPQFCLGKFGHNIDIGTLAIAAQRWLNDDGVMLFIYDPARATELALPGLIRPKDEEGQRTKEYLMGRKWELWGYFPVDAVGVGPAGALTGVLKETLKGFDRVLAYGPFGSRVLGRTLGVDIPWCPHGIYRGLPWGPKGSAARSWLKYKDWSVGSSDILVGVVATNQGRKDWGVALRALAAMGPEWKMWGHVDQLVNVWALPALVEDLGLEGRVFFTTGLGDGELAALYSACNLTFGPGLGEGFGYPLVESMACGTPVTHVNYAGGADLILDSGKIPFVGTRLEGAYSFVRPVMHPGGVARVWHDVCGVDPAPWVEKAKEYDWGTVWPRWRKWFKGEG